LPILDILVLSPVEEDNTKTESGILLVGGLDVREPKVGVVEAVGPDVKSDFSIGDTVWYSEYGAVVKGDNVIIDEKGIYCIIKRICQEKEEAEESL